MWDFIADSTMRCRSPADTDCVRTNAPAFLGNDEVIFKSSAFGDIHAATATCSLGNQSLRTTVCRSSSARTTAQSLSSRHSSDGWPRSRSRRFTWSRPVLGRTASPSRSMGASGTSHELGATLGPRRGTGRHRGLRAITTPSGPTVSSATKAP